MSERNTKQYAGQLLDRLIELDQYTAGTYYEMGRILAAIQRDKLWATLGYESFSHLIEEELTFSQTTAVKYVFVYRRLRELKYTESEALGLLTDFGLTRLADYLITATQKTGVRAIANAIQKIKEENHQINFTVNAQQYAEICAVLEQFGAKQKKSGRFEGSSEAFLEIINTAKAKESRKLQLVK